MPPTPITDRIAALIAELEELTVVRAHQTGVPMTDWMLTDPLRDEDPLWSAEWGDPEAVSRVFAHVALTSMKQAHLPVERVSIEHRQGRWGLWFARVAPVVAQGRFPAELVQPLRDAPLDARCRFLARSAEFFQQYEVRCATWARDADGALAQGRVEARRLADLVKTGVSS